MNTRGKKEAFTLLLVFLLVLTASAFAVYYLADEWPKTQTSQPAAPASQRPSTESGAPNPTQQSNGNRTFLSPLFESSRTEPEFNGETRMHVLGKICLRLLFAVLFGAALAYRPRRANLIFKRNPYVAQTQILLAVVASALMIIVGDNAARAFGIFAAVSLVRFRTNIRNPKETTVLLISLALGLGTGVGRWDLAFILTAFALVVLWILEYREPQQVFRTMGLKVATRNVLSTQTLLRELFQRHRFDSELRAVVREEQPEATGNIVYSVDVGCLVSIDQLTEQILSLDSENVDSIEWEEKKSISYIYQ